MKTIRRYLTERNMGLSYERDVRRSLQTASKDIERLVVMRSKGKGSFSAHDTDITLKIDNKPYDFEIKKNSRAQMGGISINYTDGEFTITKADQFDDETIELILEAAKTKKKDIDNVLQYFKKNDPVFKHNAKIGFPLRVSQEAWKMAVDAGVVKSLNTAVKETTSFINRYYKSKNVHYMQIGDSGLFYLDSNPLKLPVPKLVGDINIEFRAGKSGVKFNKTLNYEYSTVILRLQGRLQFNGKSDYTLDDVESIKKLFDE